jgi:hypothetical protein
MKWLHAFTEIAAAMAGLYVSARNNGLVVPVASRDRRTALMRWLITLRSSCSKSCLTIAIAACRYAESDDCLSGAATTLRGYCKRGKQALTQNGMEESTGCLGAAKDHTEILPLWVRGVENPGALHFSMNESGNSL